MARSARVLIERTVPKRFKLKSEARGAARRLNRGQALRKLDDLDVEPAHIAKLFGFLLGGLARVSPQHDHRCAVAGVDLEIQFGSHFICILTRVGSRNVFRNTTALTATI